MSDKQNTEEQIIRGKLADMQKRYENEAKPYIERLVAIECSKPRLPFIEIGLDHAKLLLR